MKIYTTKDLTEYLKNDWIDNLIADNITEKERDVRTNKWLKEIEAKRMIYADVYGDFLLAKYNQSVLDIGGGYNSLTKVLAENCDYTLVDFLAHGGENVVDSSIKWINPDWYSYYELLKQRRDTFDVIIANDIFPDVDQRLELFISQSLEIANEIRIVLTYYNNPKFYTTQRTDDAEIMTFLSWDGEITYTKIKKYLNEDITDVQKNEMLYGKESLYRNGRQVSYVVIKNN